LNTSSSTRKVPGGPDWVTLGAGGGAATAFPERLGGRGGGGGRGTGGILCSIFETRGHKGVKTKQKAGRTPNRKPGLGRTELVKDWIRAIEEAFLCFPLGSRPAGKTRPKQQMKKWTGSNASCRCRVCRILLSLLRLWPQNQKNGSAPNFPYTFIVSASSAKSRGRSTAIAANECRLGG
jgi:hypothetical protein